MLDVFATSISPSGWEWCLYSPVADALSLVAASIFGLFVLSLTRTEFTAVLCMAIIAFAMIFAGLLSPLIGMVSVFIASGLWIVSAYFRDRQELRDAMSQLHIDGGENEDED